MIASRQSLFIQKQKVWQNKVGWVEQQRVFFSDILLDDSYEGNLRKEGRSVRIVVNISSGPKTTKVSEWCDKIVLLWLH